MSPAEDEQRLDLQALLAAVEAAPPVDVVDVLAAELATMLDATAVQLLIANFSGDAVVRMSHVTKNGELHDGRNERAESFPLAGSVYERVLFGQELDVTEADGGWDLLVPVTERGDAIGVLQLTVPHRPGSDVIAYVESAAHALAYVLVASRRHTDLFEWAQRDLDFSLSAEIQRRLLPLAYTVEADTFTLAGWLEPAHTAGGDTFDYSVDREYLYLSVTDAMGHSTEAALLATLAVGSLRNSRRSLATPADQAERANEALLTSSREDQFVTGLLARVRLEDGHVDVVNAGHPQPYRLRHGIVGLLDVPPEPALGIVAHRYGTQELQLEPGDRLLFVTDGLLERKAVQLDVAGVLAASADRHPREVVRELAVGVLRETGGNLLDDATVLCLDWYGPVGHRHATGGASRERATST
ncbi:MAG TPA: PP2C family protein-serine/threonine phosphatase [Acidimicrobiales bacterium]|nr:PP2C family protein-serine/threonine phosphatase [Acidimicrobiales bacterium]